MPVKMKKGREDFSHLNYTKVADSIKPVKAEDQVNPITGEPVVWTGIFDEDESIAHEITLDTGTHYLLEVYVKATTAPNLYLDVSPDGTNWIQNYKTWNGLTEISEGFLNAFRHVRLRHDPAGVSGTDTITMVLIAK